MADENRKWTRRKAIKSIATVAGAAALFGPDLLSQAPDPQLPGNWPQLKPEETELLRIPLSEPDAKKLLEYKINGCVFRDDVVDGLKKKGLWKMPGWIMKIAMGKAFDNILKQYHEPNDWDKHKGEALTVGSLERRLWEHASNHYHEADLMNNQLGFLHRNSHKGQPPADVTKNPPMFSEYLGDEVRAKINYAGIDFAKMDAEMKLNTWGVVEARAPGGDVWFASITRNRPQLDFPYMLHRMGIDPAILKVTRQDLEQGLHMNVDQELAKVRRTASNEAPWVARMNASPDAAQKSFP